MKTFFSRIIVTLPLLLGMAAFPPPASASDTRVLSAGGLTSVLADETSDLNLFLQGNPAGLALLNSRSRVDLSGQWFDSNQLGPWGSAQSHRGSLFSPPPDSGAGYEGLMLFPSAHWAFQAAGGFSEAGGNSASSENQYRGLIRASYALSFGAIGVEALDSQNDSRIFSDPSLPAAAFLSGSSARNQLLLKTGIAALFPSAASPDQPRWQAGGFIAFPAGPSLNQRSLNFQENNSAPTLVSQTTTTTLFNASGLELLYEVPASLKIEISAALQNESSDFEQTTSAPSTFFASQPRVHFRDAQSLSLKGAFRYSLALSEDQNLKGGGSLDLLEEDTTGWANGISSASHQPQINLLLGLGLEEAKEYTMGLQWKSRSYLSENPDSAAANLYQLAFGGEKWLSPTWALRLGLVLEADDFLGGSALHTLTTSIDGGAGWEQVFGRLDFRLRLGQTLDAGNSSNTIGLFETQLSATIFL